MNSCIEDEDIDACEARQHRRVRAVAVRERELGKEPRNPAVDRPMALTADLLPERAREKRLADARRAGDEDVLMFGRPLELLVGSEPFVVYRIVEPLEAESVTVTCPSNVPVVGDAVGAASVP